IWASSARFCIVFTAAQRKAARRRSARPNRLGEGAGKRYHQSRIWSPFLCAISTFSACTGLGSRPKAKGRRSIAKVGRRGTSRSKKWTGKLLEMPPSENQQRSKIAGSAGGWATDQA